MRSVLLSTAFICCGTVYAQAQELPIFDAHIHYSHDAVQFVPPARVAKILREAGVKKALVSSSDDDGTQKLLAAAPDIVVPSLRPYRRRGAIGTWMHDLSVIDYMEDRLSRFEYHAIGEFHAFGDDIETPVLQRLIELAKERDLLLHHHGDRDALDRIFETWPEARVLWAHSGFDDPEDVADALATYPRLWSDLAFRSDVASRAGLDPAWKTVFLKYPDRFMVGTDTYAPERWYYVGPHSDFSRGWMAALPDEVARKIAFENAEAMLATRNDPCAPGEAAEAFTSESASSPKAFINLDNPPVSRPFGLELIVCAADAETEIDIDAIMPAHQHGMNYTPEIEALGNGRFKVSNMVFHMPGEWQITLKSNSGDEADSYHFDVSVP